MSVCPGCAGMLIVIIIAAKFIVRQYLVNALTTMAAKVFFFNSMITSGAIIAAMVAYSFFK